MKMIEDMLNNIKIPQLDNGEFFGKLRVELMQTFLNPQRVYRLRYRWAASIAALLFILLMLAFTSPGFVTKVNAFAFGAKNPAQEELFSQKQSVVPDIQYAEASTSITQKPQPDLTQSDKTYMVRQYDSPQRGRIMIVSEYDKKQQNNKIRKVSAGCY
ncbi:MAG: DUF3292 domain-containing protein [Candidatus Cloacimonetes bacterium]|nr:DUF3292 domain-containing protein [Candidatus Cloacimonadota bacterium]